MDNLRNAVKKLQEEELYEQIMLRGTQITDVQQPSSNNIDAIMQSIMGPGSTPPPPSPIIPNPPFVPSPAHSHANLLLPLVMLGATPVTPLLVL